MCLNYHKPGGKGGIIINLLFILKIKKKSITQSGFTSTVKTCTNSNCGNKCHCRPSSVVQINYFSFHYNSYVYHYYCNADGNIKQVPLISTNILLIIIELSRQFHTNIECYSQLTMCVCWRKYINWLRLHLKWSRSRKSIIIFESFTDARYTTFALMPNTK